jgi:hypothetical protein
VNEEAEEKAEEDDVCAVSSNEPPPQARRIAKHGRQTTAFRAQYSQRTAETVPFHGPFADRTIYLPSYNARSDALLRECDTSNSLAQESVAAPRFV